MKLEPMYNERGKQRNYYIGEDGQEYFVYHDKMTGYTIREMNKDDVIPWFEQMKVKEAKGPISPVNKMIYLASVREKVEKMIAAGSLEQTMLVLNPKNKIVGQLDFTEREPGVGYIEIALRDEKTVELKGSRIIEMIIKMNWSEKLFDQIFLENQAGVFVKIC